MIIDTLTHIWESPEQLGRRADSPRRRDPLAERLLHADPMEHFESLGPVDVAFVLAFQSRLLEARVPNRLVADYVRSHPDRLIGVAGIDPTSPSAPAELDQAVGQMGMKAVAIAPSAQGFHPMDSRALPLYRELIERDLPLIVYSGPCSYPGARMEYGRPELLDDVLREFAGLRLIVAGLGSPWIEQTLTLMTKHPNVLANLGGLLGGPWRAYTALCLAQEYGVIDRLLFSSDFPFATAVAGIETLYSINRISQGTNLPAIPRELLRGIVERDTLALLGIARGPQSPLTATGDPSPRRAAPAAPAAPTAPAATPPEAGQAARPAADEPAPQRAAPETDARAPRKK